MFGEMSIQALYTFFNCIVLLVLSCMSSLYILDINPLLDLSFANIFSLSVGFGFVDGFLHGAKAFFFLD